MGQIQQYKQLIKHFEYRLLSRQAMLLIFLIFSFQIACAPVQQDELTQNKIENDDEIDNFLEISPIFLCNEGQVIAGFNQKGQPLCETPCEAGESCKEKSTQPNSIAFGSPVSEEFICPENSYFVGFDPSGFAQCDEKLNVKKKKDLASWVSERPLALSHHLQNQICKKSQFVIGFSSKKIICSDELQKKPLESF